jgi:hypothetical protein
MPYRGCLRTALGRTALVIQADPTDVSQVAKIVEGTIAEYGRLENGRGSVVLSATPLRRLATPAAQVSR